MTTLVKIAFVIAVLAGLNWLAQTRPGLAGWVAAAPLVSLLSMSLLLLDGSDDQKITSFMTSVMFGQIPNVVFLAAFVLLLTRGFSVALALGVGALIWIASTALADKFGLLSR